MPTYYGLWRFCFEADNDDQADERLMEIGMAIEVPSIPNHYNLADIETVMDDPPVNDDEDLE